MAQGLKRVLARLRFTQDEILADYKPHPTFKQPIWAKSPPTGIPLVARDATEAVPEAEAGGAEDILARASERRQLA